MDFLHESFTVTLIEGGSKGFSFAANVVDERPPFEDILGLKHFADELGSKTVAAIARSRSSLVSMDLLIDKGGMIALFTFSSKVQMSQAKTAVDLVIKAFPPQQRESLIRSFRAFDELDRNRVVAMATLGSLRPYVPKEKEESEEKSGAIFYLPGERNPDPKFASVEAYCLALEEEERIEKASLVEESWQHTLALTDTASFSGTLAIQRAKVDWVEMAQKFATISILSVGSCKLTYIRCHREARRVLLLASAVKSHPTLSDVCQVAATLAEAGALPSPLQDRVVKSEFMKRCIAVLKTTHPSAEYDVKKLPFKDQRNIIVALGGASGCEDCPAPAEYYYHWDHKLRCWSRQSYPASAPTSSLPETLALCERCYNTNPWSCTLCRRRDTFTACRGTHPIPNGIGFHGDYKIQYHVECSCGGAFRQHRFDKWLEPGARSPLQLNALAAQCREHFRNQRLENDDAMRDRVEAAAKRQRLS